MSVGAFRHTLRVRFAETDQMGIAHHAAYVVWLEEARIAWLRSIGLSYRRLEEEGISLAVSAIEVAYRTPCRFDDEVAVDVEPSTVRSRRVAFAYRLTLVDTATPLGSGVSVHTPTDERGRAVRLPRPWLDALRAAAG